MRSTSEPYRACLIPIYIAAFLGARFLFLSIGTEPLSVVRKKCDGGKVPGHNETNDTIQVLQEELSSALHTIETLQEELSSVTNAGRNQTDGGGHRSSSPLSSTTPSTSTPSVLPREQVLKPAWPHDPALVVGLPKTGTQSIADYFSCGCYNVTHYANCNSRRMQSSNAFCGKLVLDNIAAGVDPLLNTGDANVYAQLDLTNKDVCFYPQIDALEEIHKYHPHSTFILNTRNVTHWIHSVNHWVDMRKRFIGCNLTDLPAGVGSRDEDMIRFYHGQVKRIRDFCKKYPSHALVEIDVESKETGAILEQAFGISSECWGKNDHRTGNGGLARKRLCGS